MANLEEVRRVEGFDSGTVKCDVCGKDITLWFNGGELDSVECCGLVYSTEIQRVDLVVRRKRGGH